MSNAPAMVTEDPRRAKPRFSGPAEEVAPGVFMYSVFVNSYAMKTADGLLLVDPGTMRGAALAHQAIRGWTNEPVHTIVYTHGHIDHAFGGKPFLAEGAVRNIVAQENCVGRFQRYSLTHGYNQIINQRQFGSDKLRFPDEFDWPTLTFRDGLVQRMGGLEISYRAAKGETDDHCYIWVPEKSYLFSGDLIIWRSPNCGNPQKVQRYPIEWAEALEEMAALDAEWLFPGHGLVVHGRAEVRRVLTETARYLRHIIDQVVPLLNAGKSPEEIVAAVESDPELATRPYLLELYDHPKFIVHNLIRRWGGWWNGVAADLFPASSVRQAQEIATLAGGAAALIARGRALLDQGDLEMACHVAEWAIRVAPDDRAALELKRDVYEKRGAATGNLMAQGIYRGAMNEALDALGQERAQRAGHQSL